jgi:hypothetical protein
MRVESMNTNLPAATPLGTRTCVGRATRISLHCVARAALVLMIAVPLLGVPVVAMGACDVSWGNPTSESVFWIGEDVTLSWSLSDCAGYTATRLDLVQGTVNITLVKTLTTDPSDLTNDEFDWRVGRGTGTGANNYKTKLTLKDENNNLHYFYSSYFKINRGSVTDPSGSAIWAEATTQTIKWVTGETESAGKFNIYLLQDGSRCKTIATLENEALRNYSWQVEPCDEAQTDNYRIELEYEKGSAVESFYSSTFSIPSCTATISNPGQVAAATYHCSTDLPDKTLLKVSFKNDRPVSINLTKLVLNLQGGNSILTGKLKYNVEGGSFVDSPNSYTAAGNYTLLDNPAPVITIPAGATKTIEVRTKTVDSPGDNTASVTAQLVPSSSTIEFDPFPTGNGVCEFLGSTVTGNPLTATLYPHPTTAFTTLSDSALVWCAPDASVKSTGIQFGLGEDGERSYNVTGMKVNHDNGVNFDLVRRVRLYNGADSIMTSGVIAGGASTVTLSLISGKQLHIDKGAAAGSSLTIQYLWKNQSPDTEKPFIPQISEITTSFSSYCGGNTPFQDLIGADGRRLVRIPPGRLLAEKSGPSADLHPCLGTPDANGYCILKFSLANTSTRQAMGVVGVTLDAAASQTFATFSKVLIHDDTANTDYAKNNPGTNDSTKVATTGLSIPPTAYHDFSVYVFPKTPVTEADLQLRVSSLDYAGEHTDGCTYIGDTTEYGVTLKVRLQPSLTMGSNTVTGDVYTCAPLQEYPLLRTTLYAQNYGSGSVPYLSTVSFSITGTGGIGAIDTIKLYRGTSSSVAGDLQSMTFSVPTSWTLEGQSQEYSIWIKPKDLDNVHIYPTITSVQAIDPDGCTITSPAALAGKTLNLEKRAVLTTASAAIPDDDDNLDADHERTICGSTTTDIPVLKFSVQADASEAAYLNSITLDSSGHWEGVSNVNADVNDERYVGSTWTSSTKTLSFSVNNRPVIPKSSPLTMTIRFSFNDSRTLYQPYQPKVSAASCIGQDTGNSSFPPSCQTLAWPGQPILQDPTPLAFRPAGALTVNLTESVPPAGTIPPVSSTKIKVGEFTIQETSAREGLRIDTVTISDCLGNQALSQYVSDAELKVGNNTYSNPVLGEDIIFSPNYSLSTSGTATCTLNAAFNKSWTDAGTGPRIKLKPTVTTWGESSLSKCPVPITVTQPDCPTNPLLLERIGNAGIAYRTTGESEDKFITCGSEESILSFTIRVSAEESGSLNALTLSLGSVGCSACYSGTFAIYRESGTPNGIVDPAEVSSQVVGTPSTDNTVFFQFTPAPLVIDRNSTAAFIVTANLNRSDTGNGRFLRPQFQDSGCDLTGAQTGAQIVIPSYDWGDRTVKMILRALAAVTADPSNPDDCSAAQPGSESKVLELHLQSYSCASIPAGVWFRFQTISGVGIKDIDRARVTVDGETHFSDQLDPSDNDDDFTSAPLYLPELLPNTEHTISVYITPRGSAITADKDYVRLNLSDQDSYFIPQYIYEACFQYSGQPRFQIKNCTDPDTLQFANDSESQWITMLSTGVRGSALPTAPYSLSKITFTQKIGTLSSAYDNLQLVIDPGSQSEQTVSRSSQAPLEFTLNPPLEFSAFNNEHSFKLQAHSKSTLKSGTYQLGLNVTSGLQFTNPAWDCQGTCECSGTVVIFRAAPTLTLCSCSSLGGTEDWMFDEVPAIAFTLQNQTQGSEIVVDSLSFNVSGSFSSLLTDIASENGIHLYRRPAGCDNPQGETPLGIFYQSLNSGAQPTVRIHLYPDPDGLTLDHGSPVPIVMTILGKDRDSFRNGAPFTFQSMQVFGHDKTVDDLHITGVSNACSAPQGPVINPYIPGWAKLEGQCVGNHTSAWDQIAALTLTAQKEDLKPFTFTFHLASTGTLETPNGDAITFDMRDGSGVSVAESVPFVSRSSPIVFSSFPANLKLTDGAVPTTWYLTVSNVPGGNNTNKTIVVDGTQIPSGLQFKGQTTGQTVVAELPTSLPYPTCEYTIAPVVTCSLAHQPLDPQTATPDQSDVVILAEVLSVPQTQATPLFAKSLKCAMSPHFADTGTQGEVSFLLQRKVAGTWVNATAGSPQVSWPSQEVTFGIIDASTYRQIDNTAPAEFRVVMNVVDLDAGDTFQMTSGCDDAWRIEDAGSIQRRFEECTGTAAGPVVTFRSGPCENAKGTRLDVPNHVRSGLEFTGSVELHDNSGVADSLRGNPIPGVPAASFSTWEYPNFVSSFSALPLADVTDNDGIMRFRMTISGASHQAAGTLRCDVGGNCTPGATLQVISGMPNVGDAVVDNARSDQSKIYFGLELLDAQNNLLNTSDFVDVTILNVSGVNGLGTPVSEGDGFHWSITRQGNFGTAKVDVLITPTDGIGTAVTLLDIPLRVPEYIAPTIDPQARPVVDEIAGPAISVSTFRVFDNNNSEQEPLRVFLALRAGWDDSLRTIELATPVGMPSDGATFPGQDVALSGEELDPSTSLDWKIFVEDYDGNGTEYPQGNFASLPRPLAFLDKVLDQQYYWHYFALPDSFSASQQLPVGGVFSMGQEARKDRWAVCEYVGGGSWDWYGKPGGKLTTVRSGRGYWAKTVLTGGISIHAPALATRPTNAPVEIRLNGGGFQQDGESATSGDFTFVGNPFSFPLGAPDLKRALIVKSNGDTIPLYTESDGWSLDFTLYKARGAAVSPQWDVYGAAGPGRNDLNRWTIAPWEAQYLRLSFVDASPKLVWIPPDLTFTAPHKEAPATARMAPECRWSIELRAVDGDEDNSDPLVVEGFDGASEGYDVLDCLAPPSPESETSIRLVSHAVDGAEHPSTENLGTGYLIGDARPTSEGAHTIPISVICGSLPPESVELVWDKVDIPDGWSARIVSVMDIESADLRTERSLHYPIMGTRTIGQLALVVAPDTEIDAALARILPPPPARPQILPSSPNPFSHLTRIRFGLPAAQGIQLSIFDVQGRRVRTLIDSDRIESGFHTLLWDGKDESGTLVPSGVYWVRLNARGESAGARVVVLR